jgi:hypothetical protein
MDGSIRQESGSVLNGMGLLCSEFTTGSFLGQRKGFKNENV